MSTTKNCSIKLLNKTYEIKCPEGEEDNLREAAEKIDQQLRLNKQNFAQLDELQNLVLAALHVSHELITCHKQQEQQRHQVTQFINSLETKINEVVNGNPLLDPQTD